jgi:hypothetical protein
MGMTRALLASLVALAALAVAPARAAAQDAPPPRQVAPPAPIPPRTAEAPFQRLDVTRENGGALETRRELYQVMRRLPPTLGEILQRDPSLLQRPDYLAPYPALVAFLQQHPEVLRDPAFYFGAITFRERDPAEASIEMFEMILAGLAMLTAFSILVSLIVWLVRTVVDHRRWLRLSRVQAEVHTKLMDRLTSNEDLLSYIQTPAGRRFLESAPIAVDGEPRQPAAPLSRIVWSLQAGVVLFALGMGIYLSRGRVPAEVGQGLSVLGTIVVALGLGFAVSAVLAYMITSRFGLVPPPKPAVHE